MKSFYVLATAFILASCGPTYTTNYNLNPAPTKEGQLCSANVKLMADTCLANCVQMSRSCRSSGFNTSIGYGSGGYRHGGWGYQQSLMDDRDCSTVQCEDSCKTATRQGHLNCGGTITQDIVCTSNCPKPE